MWKGIAGLLLLLSCEGASADSQTKATECGRELFRQMLVRRGYASDAKLENLLGETVMVERQSRPQWSMLGGEVFLAQYTFQRPIVEAWIIADADVCTVLGGDLETILGVRMNSQDQVAHAVHEYNAYVRATRTRPPLSTPADLETYVAAVLELLIPSHRCVIVTEMEDVPTEARAEASERQRVRTCLAGIRSVDVQIGATRSKVSLISWEEVGGILASNSVLVFPNGEVAVSREVICERIGQYRVRGRL